MSVGLAGSAINTKAANCCTDGPIYHPITPLLLGFIVLYMYLNDFNLSSVVRTMSTFLVIVVTADVIRLNYRPFEIFYESVLGFLMREAEKVSSVARRSEPNKTVRPHS